MAQNYTNSFLETQSPNDTSLESFSISTELNYEPPYSTTSLILPNNGTDQELPIDMKFNDGHRLAIVVYSLLMSCSALGNIYVLTLIISLHRKGKFSRIDLFLLHLTIADLLVTFLMMPLEIGWHYYVSWNAGDLMCRLLSFPRIFGLYLSGFVLVVISLDLFFAVVKPLGIAYANGRAKLMLAAAWIASFICSLPQPIIFHVEKHPNFQWYEQCVTFNAFPSKLYETAYNMFSFFFLYVFPLSMIVFCYSCILYKVYRVNNRKSRATQLSLRRSNSDALGRARIRTLKMTVTIVATFFFCWTPYNIMSLWYWIDSKSAQAVDQRIQKGFFLFACTNSVLNPFIYSFFHFWRTPKPSQGPAPNNDGKQAQRRGNKQETNMQWSQNGYSRVTVEGGDSGADISVASFSRPRDMNTHKKLTVGVSDCETYSYSTRLSSSSCGSPIQTGKFGTRETQV